MASLRYVSSYLRKSFLSQWFTECYCTLLYFCFCFCYYSYSGFDSWASLFGFHSDGPSLLQNYDILMHLIMSSSFEQQSYFCCYSQVSHPMTTWSHRRAHGLQTGIYYCGDFFWQIYISSRIATDAGQVPISRGHGCVVCKHTSIELTSQSSFCLLPD